MCALCSSFEGVEMSYAALAENHSSSPTLFVSMTLRIVSYMMVGIGCVYMIMGLLCLKGVAERTQLRYDEQVAEIREKRQALQV